MKMKSPEVKNNLYWIEHTFRDEETESGYGRGYALIAAPTEERMKDLFYERVVPWAASGDADIVVLREGVNIEEDVLVDKILH